MPTRKRNDALNKIQSQQDLSIFQPDQLREMAFELPLGFNRVRDLLTCQVLLACDPARHLAPTMRHSSALGKKVEIMDWALVWTSVFGLRMATPCYFRGGFDNALENPSSFKCKPCCEKRHGYLFTVDFIDSHPKCVAVISKAFHTERPKSTWGKLSEMEYNYWKGRIALAGKCTKVCCIAHLHTTIKALIVVDATLSCKIAYGRQAAAPAAAADP